ncbi:MAG: ribonuclease H family protein [Saprospiraceae bacterium]|nr:ribonuclease H family protein [Saprospiraceae bacterium]
MAKKQRYYVVWVGQKPGIYDSWAACQAQTNGFPNASYKAFDSKLEAEHAFQSGVKAFSPQGARKSKAPTKAAPKQGRSAIIYNSIAVDAACSGNPGVMEYQGVFTLDKQQLFHQKFQLGTNNIGEFLGIVHALAYCKKNNLGVPIYTDSKTALGWVSKKHCKTTLERTAKTRELFELVDRAEEWLHQNTWQNPILKWETEVWGEIPADFGRKG